MNLSQSLIGSPSQTRYRLAGVGGVIRNENKAKLLALKIGLQEATNLHPHRLPVKGDSFCAIQWASQSTNPPCYLADIIEEVIQLSGDFNTSFHHIKHSANNEADRLAKEGVLKTKLHISI